MKIYTKTGDKGETSLFSGERVRKNALAVEAYGAVDEVNSCIGFCVSACDDKDLKDRLMAIQHDLHIVCADLATNIKSEKKVPRVEVSMVEKIEKLIDETDSKLKPLKNFILPGGTELSSRLHIARTLCRRSERQVLHFADGSEINDLCTTYLNRLSDYLFVLAREANHLAGVDDVIWKT